MLINTKDLFLKQYIAGKLNRYDIVIRYLAAQNYISHSQLHRLYKIDCIERGKFVNSTSDVSVTEGMQRFTKTILSFILFPEFDEDHPIDVYTNYNIKDGIHRLAVCLYMKIKNVHIKINGGDPCKNYPTLDYYRNVLNKKQLRLLINKEKEILND